MTLKEATEKMQAKKDTPEYSLLCPTFTDSDLEFINCFLTDLLVDRSLGITDRYMTESAELDAIRTKVQKFQSLKWARGRIEF